MKKRTIVVALGGNALLKKNEKLTVNGQMKAMTSAMNSLVPLFRKRDNIVITHGSGPQVGNLLLQNEMAKREISPSPLYVLDAEIEGGIGYMLAQSLLNVLKKRNLKRPVVTVVTQVLVDRNDPMFKKPTKPIGPFYSKEEADVFRRNGFYVVEDAGRGYRRVVASPKPIEIIESKSIKSLCESGTIVIAAGGGGIPVYKTRDEIHGVAAVIDKDLASSCLANGIGAEMLLILTGVGSVCLHYGTSREKRIKRMNVKDAKKYLKEGHFPEGSMGPKIEAAIDFLSKGGKKVIITSPEKISDAVNGESGTEITR